MPTQPHKDATERASTTTVTSITNTDLHQFWEAHFSPSNVAYFSSTFVHDVSDAGEAQQEDWIAQDEEDDDLGYYDDGVKRTLTDEQIEIFRHSEVEAMRKAQERTAGKGIIADSDMLDAPSEPTSRVQSPLSTIPSHSKEQQGSKKKKKRRQEAKPDLRKRTWDVVDQGLDTLEYD